MAFRMQRYPYILSLALVLGAGLPAGAANRYDRYVLVLRDAPAATQAVTRKDFRSTGFLSRMAKIESAHAALRRQLTQEQVEVTSEARLLGNLMFVRATPQQAQRLAVLPPVAKVQRLLPIHRLGEPALDLVQASTGWTHAGGAANAGSGVRIAVLDTGIDNNHPAFQDPDLTVPDDITPCDESTGACAYVNNKVIIARSYVQYLVGDQAIYSRPDDLSPRDHVGHGTAVAMLAGGTAVTGPAGDTGGVAPKAYLGNYKIFGSPGVNDITFYDAVVPALEDAIADKMDIAVLAFGAPALWGANDQGASCGLEDGQSCDWRVDVVENAIRLGLTIVAGAGDDGNGSIFPPAMGTIESPGTSPSVITVGSMTNAHDFFSTVTFGDQQYAAMPGRGYQPDGVLTAPLKDVSTLNDDGTACSTLADDSLKGDIALIQFGTCDFTTQINHAQKAGAVGVLFYQYDGYDGLFRVDGIEDTGIPVALIGSSSATKIKAALAAAPDSPVTLDPASYEYYDSSYAGYVTYFNSYGPALGTNAIKPDVVAPATGIYVATQAFDPNGNLYDKSGYTAVQGSSFAAGLVAGIAALVKQQNPSMTPAQIKGAIVGTAYDQVADFDSYGNVQKASVTAVGAGLADADWSLTTTVTASPATVSIAPVTSTQPTQTVTVSNLSDSPVTLSAYLQPDNYNPYDSSQITVDPSNFTIDPKSSRDVTFSITSPPLTGSYEGRVYLFGGPVEIQIPYLYIVGDGIPANLIPTYGDNFAFDANGEILRPALAARVIDGYGLPVPDQPVEFTSYSGGAITSQSGATDYLGISDAGILLGPDPGPQSFSAKLGDLELYYTGRARLTPTINPDGVTDAASGEPVAAYAPGSYIAIAGSGLSEASKTRSTPYLPMSLAGVSLSFDVEDPKISTPGHLHSVSDGRIIAQIPWELAGQTSAQMKVSIGDSSSELFTIPLTTYAPAAFQVDDNGSRIVDALHTADKSAVNSASPAIGGETVLLAMNGLGPLDNQPLSGEPAQADPAPVLQADVSVTIGGVAAEVTAKTLATGSVGRYQLSVVVAPGTPSGPQPVIVTVNGVESKAVNLPIQ